MLVAELKDHLAEYPSIRDHGWTDGELEAIAKYVHDFLSERIGPVQEKLFNDLEIARERVRRAERDRDILATALAEVASRDEQSAESSQGVPSDGR